MLGDAGLPWIFSKSRFDPNWPPRPADFTLEIFNQTDFHPEPLFLLP
jgi:hypothetical protein